MLNEFILWNLTEIIKVNCDNTCENIKKICNIENHLYILTEKNHIYHGLINNNEISLYLQENIKAIDIDCCPNSVYVVEEDTGLVYKYTENFELLEEIELLDECRICIHGNSRKCKAKVRMISAGEFGMLFVTEAGQLWASGHMKQIGIFSEYPRRVSHFDGKIVHGLDVGFDFAVVIVSKAYDPEEYTDDDICISNCQKCLSMSQLNSPISNQDRNYNIDSSTTSSTNDTTSNSSSDAKKFQLIKDSNENKVEKNIIFRNTEAAKEFLTRQFSWMSAGEEYLVEYTEKPKRIIKENVTNMASLVYEGVRTVGDKVVTLSKHVNSSFENNDDSIELVEGIHLPRLTSSDEFNWSLSQGTSDKDISQQSSLETCQCIIKRGSSLINREVWTWGNIMHGQLGLGDNIKRDQPMMITKLLNIGAHKLSIQYLHSALLTLDGRAYLWGRNCYNQVTTENNIDQSSPKQFLLTNNERILDAACTNQSSVLLTSNFNIFYMGKNADNIITLYDGNLIRNQSTEPSKRAVFLLKTSSYTLFNNNFDLNIYIKGFLLSEQKTLEEMILVYSTILKHLERKNQETSLVNTICRNYAELMYFTAANVENLMLLLMNKFALYCDILIVKQIDEFIYFYKNYLSTLFDFISMGGCTMMNELIDIPQAVYTHLDLKKEHADEAVIINDVLMKPFHKIIDYSNTLLLLMKDDNLSINDEKSLNEVYLKWNLFKDEQQKKETIARCTNLFWANSGKTIKNLRTCKRRLVRDSHKSPLFLVNASRFSSHWFILFNDVFVHVNGSNAIIHELNTVWVEPQQEDEEVSSNQYQLLLKMPEDNYILYTQTPEEKMEWLHDFQTAINFVFGERNSHQIPPINRSSSYNFKARNGPLKEAKYTGRWSRAKMNGYGKMEWIDGRIYTGQFLNNQFHGFGKIKMPGKGIYEGQWKDNLQNGFGIMKYDNGDVYKGFFKDGLSHGHGSLKQGRFTSSAASIYIGDFLMGNKNGYGVMDDIAAGEKYLGNWTDNKKQGNGILVNSDGIYYEGTFNQDTLTGHGLMILEDGTHYEGEFKGTGILNGKGTLTLKSGHTIEGTLLGSLNDELRISNAVLKIPTLNCETTISKNFGTCCTPLNNKWRALFKNCYQILGAGEKQTKGVDNQKIWQNVAIIISNSRQSDSQKRKIDRAIENSLKHLDTIPRFCRTTINVSEYQDLKCYLHKAFDCPYHPLGSLLGDLTSAYTTTYGGPSAHPLLLTHAVNELHSITRRIYDIVRLLFPALPAFEEETKILEEENFANIISCENLLYPIILPRVHSPLFILYTLRNKQQEAQYWKRLLEWNKHSDHTLMAFLSVDVKFLKTDMLISSPSKDESKKDETYLEAIETLQQLKTTFSPLEKLMVIRETFQKISEVGRERLGVDYRWNMDDLLPVFLYIVVRARIPELGSELNFITDFMEPNLESGELGIMFTTLKACYHQILQEKISIL